MFAPNDPDDAPDHARDPMIQRMVRGQIRWALRIVVIGASAIALSACGNGSKEPSAAELLQEIEGRPLTAAELAEREQIAAMMCSFDDDLLLTIWDQLSTRQLAFQDFVFGRSCPNKTPLYREATGRLQPTEG